jgi:glycosyltransferase involved in cell wall biosynthesis
LLRRNLLERAGGRPDSTLLLYVGRFSPEKNLGLLMHTLQRLLQTAICGDRLARNYRMIVVGDGPSRESLERAARRMTPGRTLLVGTTGGELLRRYYARADVFVHPNPHEPFGIAPLEAMASGVLVCEWRPPGSTTVKRVGRGRRSRSRRRLVRKVVYGPIEPDGGAMIDLSYWTMEAKR